MSKIIKIYGLLFGALLLLAGCATPIGTAGSSSATTSSQITTRSLLSDRHQELVITDIVSAMVQINELSPFNTTLQYSPTQNEFGEKMVEALDTAGYGLQQVSQDQGANYIGYSNSLADKEIGRVREIEVNVGGISIQREYQVDGSFVVPASIMYINGSQSFSNIILNDNIFLQQGGNIVFETGVELETLSSEVITTDVKAVRGDGGSAGSVRQQDSIITAKNNIFNKDQGSIDRELYKPLRRVELSFEDFTVKLGRGNKRAVGQLIDGFKASTDIIAIASCVGSSGTELQARERASRVKEEFLLQGLSGNTIVDIGCDISEYINREVKSRTVVVTQRRQDESTDIIASNRLPTEYPHRPIVLTIPYGSGGATDFQARIATMVAGNEDYLGQPIAIVNKPGSGGRAGWTWFVNTAASNGYDIASYNVPHFIAQSIKFETPYNIDTLEPVANWGADPAVLVVPANSPYTTLREFVSAARSNPASMTVSGAGLYVGHHIAALQLSNSANVSLDYQTAKGGAAALKQVINGEVDAGINNMSDAFRSRDQLRILAIADVERHRFVPDVPTFRELGVNVDNASVNFRGIMVPKGTPLSIISKLEREFLNMFDDPIVLNRMEEGGSPMRVMGRDEVLSMWNQRQASLQTLLKGL